MIFPIKLKVFKLKYYPNKIRVLFMVFCANISSGAHASQIECFSNALSQFRGYLEIGGLYDAKFYYWDNWATFDQKNGIYHRFSLGSPTYFMPDGRHEEASLHYFTSKDAGKKWIKHGVIIPSNKEYKIWSGSAKMANDGSIQLFYTQSMKDKKESQVLKSVIIYPSPNIVDSPKLGLFQTILDPRDESVKLQARQLGIHLADEDGLISAFRDPYFFENTLYFATKYKASDGKIIPTIGRAQMDPITKQWKLLSPINLPVQGHFTQIEVPNIIKHFDEYYIFVSTSDSFPGKTRFQVNTSVQVFRSKNLDGPWLEAGINGSYLFDNKSRIYALNIVTGASKIMATGFYRNSHLASYTATALIQLHIENGRVVRTMSPR